jgi:ferredoxin
MGLRVVVDRDLCEANAVCVGEAPEVFGIDEESRLVVLREQPGSDLVADLRRAVGRCPRGALSLAED